MIRFAQNLNIGGGERKSMGHSTKLSPSHLSGRCGSSDLKLCV